MSAGRQNDLAGQVNAHLLVEEAKRLVQGAQARHDEAARKASVLEGRQAADDEAIAALQEAGDPDDHLAQRSVARRKTRGKLEDARVVLVAREKALEGAITTLFRARLAAGPEVWQSLPLEEEIERWRAGLLAFAALTRQLDARLEQRDGLRDYMRALARPEGPLKGGAQVPSIKLPLPVSHHVFAYFAVALFKIEEAVTAATKEQEQQEDAA